MKVIWHTGILIWLKPKSFEVQLVQIIDEPAANNRANYINYK